MALVGLIFGHLGICVSTVDDVVNVENCLSYLEYTRHSEIDKVNHYQSVIGDTFFDSVDCFPHTIDSNKDDACLERLEHAPSTANHDVQQHWHIPVSDDLIKEADDDCKHSHGQSEQPQVSSDLRDLFLLCIDHIIKEAV